MWLYSLKKKKDVFCAGILKDSPFNLALVKWWDEKKKDWFCDYLAEFEPPREKHQFLVPTLLIQIKRYDTIHTIQATIEKGDVNVQEDFSRS